MPKNHKKKPSGKTTQKKIVKNRKTGNFFF